MNLIKNNNYLPDKYHNECRITFDEFPCRDPFRLISAIFCYTDKYLPEFNGVDCLSIWGISRFLVQQ